MKKMMGWRKEFICLATFIINVFAIPSMDSYLNMASDEESSQEGVSSGKKSTNCSCGYTNKARIVGGKETLVNEFPLIAGILTETYEDLIFCGGTIISQYHVVTAAHCTAPYEKEQMSVVVGEHKQFEENESQSTEVIPVEKVIQHEGYEKKIMKNDISLLVLSKKLQFTQTIGPACLPEKGIKLENEQVKVIGWGRTENQFFSDVLMKVNMRVIPVKHCTEVFPTKYVPVDEPKQICAIANKKDSCQGDSGGPVIWLDPETNRYTLVALVSFGKKNCASNVPAVNTDVSAYMDWIQENIAASKPDAQTCSKNG